MSNIRGARGYYPEDEVGGGDGGGALNDSNGALMSGSGNNATNLSINMFPPRRPSSHILHHNNTNNSSNMAANEKKLAEMIPEEYLYDPYHAEPSLDNLRAAFASFHKSHQTQKQGHNKHHYNNKQQTSTASQHEYLSMLLEAADKDILVHNSRIKAVLAKDPSLLQTYSTETDPVYQERIARREALHQHIQHLQSQTNQILTDLNTDNDDDFNSSTDSHLRSTTVSSSKHFTRDDVLNVRLQKWERALQLYVHCPPQNDDSDSPNMNSNNITSTTLSSNSAASPTLQTLLQKLCQKNQTQEEELTEALTQASLMTSSLLEQTSTAVQDATTITSHTEDAYHIRLEAHSVLAKYTMNQTKEIQSSFLQNGREALKIGHALEMAEAQRRQCETASILIRRWWTMENLAQQEELSGEVIRVQEEVRGVIPSSSCKLDPLFTRVEHSLEAARTLKSLRNIVKSRGNSASVSVAVATASSAGGGGMNGSVNGVGVGGSVVDPNLVQRKFEVTNGLIQRVSSALEQRLLNTFSEVYTRGGTYDFSSLRMGSAGTSGSTGGRLDWVTLREVAEALTSFDSGRSLHKRYVGLVVTTKFPELFHDQYNYGYSYNDADNNSDEDSHDGRDDDSSKDDEELEDKYGEGNMEEKTREEREEFDMDAMRTKLSSLFHRVCEVCTKEFQLIAHVFSPSLPYHLTSASKSSTGIVNSSIPSSSSSSSISSFSETYPLQVARALLQRVISDPRNGMQARINDLLSSIDQRGDFDAGSKKLDTFVVIHEKAAGLFSLLKEAAEKMWGDTGISSIDRNPLSQGGDGSRSGEINSANASNRIAVTSLIQFLTSQEMSLSSGHRRGYLNLELRLLHHECCYGLDRIGAKLLKPVKTKDDAIRVAAGSGLVEYRAPLMPLDKEYIKKGGFEQLLNGPLKQATLMQPLIHATDSLARARLMFGVRGGGGGGIDSTARVILAIFSQMCNFYGQSYLFPIVESLGKMLVSNPPNMPPTLPFDEDENAKPHDLGVDGNFWISIERIHSAAKAFDRELWAENRPGSVRVWEILKETRCQTSLTLAKDRRIRFFQDLEERGEAIILRALDTLSAHIQWILVKGGAEAMGSGGSRLLQNLTGQGAGPYAVPTGSLLDSPNSPAVKALTFCLRSQFIQIQSALTPQSLSAFWTALSMRLYDILVTRLLQHYYVSTVGAVILSRDVEALRSVAMLTGTDHSHWDNLRELLTLYMTPPDALKTMLVGVDTDVSSSKGLFGRAGKDQSLVFMSRRVDYRYKTNQGLKKSQWVVELLEELGVNDPTDRHVNIALYAAERKS